MKKMLILGMTVLILSLAVAGCNKDPDFEGTWTKDGGIEVVIEGSSFKSSVGGYTASEGTFSYDTKDEKVTFKVTKANMGSELISVNFSVSASYKFSDDNTFVLSGAKASDNTYSLAASSMSGTYKRK